MGQGSWLQPLTVYLIFLLVSSCWIPCSMSVANFRPVRAVPRIYRCAKTEGLADVITPTTEAERIILQESGLIIDLRSRDERNDKICNVWMVRFGFELEDDENCNDRRSEDCMPQRRVRRIDIMSRRRMMDYMSSEWLTPFQKMTAPILELLDPNRLHEMRIEALNQRGLSGLNEAILESGGHQLCLALIEMTTHLEKYETSVIIHCVQGKDRTGILSMLCQSIMGISDEAIIGDYYQSDFEMRDPSAASAKLVKGRLHKRMFTGAPRKAMKDTLEFLRQKYGSVSPGYLDSIGFTCDWRDRLVACLSTSDQSIVQRIPSKL